MGCCARRALLVAMLMVAGGGMHSQVWGQVTVRVAHSQTLGSRTALAFAARWAVVPADVRIEWTNAELTRETVPAGAALAILGDGADGRFVVEITDPDGRVRRVWVRAGVIAERYSAALDLPRGMTIDSTHVERAAGVAWGGPAHGQDNTVVGWVTRRAIAAGEPLEEPAIAPPAAVRAGDDVRVIVRRGAIELAIIGRALATATAGERVAVRLETGKRMTGIAARGGTVVVSDTENGR